MALIGAFLLLSLLATSEQTLKFSGSIHEEWDFDYETRAMKGTTVEIETFRTDVVVRLTIAFASFSNVSIYLLNSTTPEGTYLTLNTSGIVFLALRAATFNPGLSPSLKYSIRIRHSLEHSLFLYSPIALLAILVPLLAMLVDAVKRRYGELLVAEDGVLVLSYFGQDMAVGSYILASLVFHPLFLSVHSLPPTIEAEYFVLYLSQLTYLLLYPLMMVVHYTRVGLKEVLNQWIIPASRLSIFVSKGLLSLGTILFLSLNFMAWVTFHYLRIIDAPVNYGRLFLISFRILTYSILLLQLVSMIVYLFKNKLVPPLLILIYLLIADPKSFFLTGPTMRDILLTPGIVALELVLAQWQLKERFIL